MSRGAQVDSADTGDSCCCSCRRPWYGICPIRDQREEHRLPKGTVRIDNDVITVEIAETAAEQQRWLTFRQDRLPFDTAMLIKHEEPDLYEVWMLNIEYNLDLIWFDENGNAVYIKENVPPCDNVVETISCTYKSTKPALYLMAATAGFIDVHNIAIGSNMTTISV